ncbi:MAG: SDR family oxidoreductase, partial [[Clostridium] leptum]
QVNCVAPGVVDTKMNAGLTPEELQALRDETPLGVIGTSEDIAQAIWFLASPESDFITGQVLSPNGGFLI